jgi:hypothetical protein
MSLLFWSSLILQTVLMVFDEFYFHHRRGLPKWERLGHPVDTFFFLIPLSILSFSQPSPTWRLVYTSLAIVSCLVITKDEWIHRTNSTAGEQWLHSVLFILHPTVLISAFFVWTEAGANFIWVLSAVAGFWVYQLLFWNIYGNRILKT